ncbi:MAG TPA: hypothetical protein VHF87_14370 [Methylomirabilota bacterium]|jgi:hypothetical protein|nr:hypothetical protein [Methylomirabilota bacterium]
MARIRAGQAAGAPTGGGAPVLGRRTLLGMALAWVLVPSRRASAESESRRGTFSARATMLYGAFRFEESGTIHESIDRTAGRYEVRITGHGPSMSTEIESTGTLRAGRWAPLRFTDRFVVYGRESRLDIAFDHARRLVQYRGRSETFLLRRLRVTDDDVSVPAGVHVDDVVSATLNYAEARWPPESDGRLVTRIVRRERIRGERPDDAAGRYRAELVPFELRVGPDTDGRATALLDLTRFSSWAREDEPARIVFSADRRPEAITASLILGTSLAIRFGPPPVAAL